MGRRGVLSNMPKMVLPTVSWVAVIRLLKKAPKNLGPPMGAEMALSALLGCGAAPQTHSSRYTDDTLVHIKGRCRPKPAAMLPIIGGCSSRPHTDSFRVHHVVNQEALQLMLSFGDDDTDFDHDAFFESEELNCYDIIRDGDRLLHDDIFEDGSARASSSMRTCSSSLSSAASTSLTGSACTALSRRSVDSEGLYSTANSASFGHVQSTPEFLNAGPHISCDSRPSSSIISSCDASELIYREANSLHHNLKLEAREEPEGKVEVEQEEELRADDAEEDAYLDIYAQQDQIYPTFTNCGVVHAIASNAGDEIYDDDAAGIHEDYEGDADDEGEGEEEEEEILAEMRYSEDPLEDFAAAISRMVVRQQLNKAAQLQELYWCFLRLNAPRHHHTITLAFLHALQRLASFEPQHLETLL